MRMSKMIMISVTCRLNYNQLFNRKCDCKTSVAFLSALKRFVNTATGSGFSENLDQSNLRKFKWNSISNHKLRSRKNIDLNELQKQ